MTLRLANEPLKFFGEVASPYANPGRAIILVTLESVDGETEVIEATDNHPFYEGKATH